MTWPIEKNNCQEDLVCSRLTHMNKTEYKASEQTDLCNVIISNLEGSRKPSLTITTFLYFLP